MFPILNWSAAAVCSTCHCVKILSYQLLYTVGHVLNRIPRRPPTSFRRISTKGTRKAFGSNLRAYQYQANVGQLKFLVEEKSISIITNCGRALLMELRSIRSYNKSKKACLLIQSQMAYPIGLLLYWVLINVFLQVHMANQ